jgi:ribosomal protein S18 acetylase RimI-like enzyme
MRFQSSIDGVEAAHLTGGFFEGWPDPPSAETHLRILQGSRHVALAVDENAGDVVGFATMVGDGVLSAYIPFLEVLPPHRGQGVGRRLVEMLLDAGRDCYMIDAVCDDDVVPFYEQLGMRRGTAVMWRNYGRQSGQ